MMLTREQVNEAQAYNANKRQRPWKRKQLRWPWDEAIGKNRFAWITALFQAENGLQVDGKLGPKTWAAVQGGGYPTPLEIPVVKKKETTLSNCFIVAGKRVMLSKELLDSGITASNYVDDGEPHFDHKIRTQKLQHFVLHETCGNTAKGCKNTLLRKEYGVQLILDPKGHLSCHGDLATETMYHANQLNKTSIGMEVVNPYSPLYARPPFTNVFPREWWTWVPSAKNEDVREILKRKGLTKVPKEYVTPTDAQMNAVRLIVPWICNIVGVPYRFPTKGLSKKKRKIDSWNVKPKGRPGPGVVAHRDFASHSDGRYILEDLIGKQNEQ